VGLYPELIPPTVPEVRRVIVAMARPKEEREFRLGWSVWRRAHQAVAKRSHAATRKVKCDSLRESARSRIARVANNDDKVPLSAGGYFSHRREVGMCKAANALAEAAHRTTETRSSSGTRCDGVGFGHRIFVAGSARRGVWAVADGIGTLAPMAQGRPLAADNGSAQALSVMRTTPSRDRSVTVGLGTSVNKGLARCSLRQVAQIPLNESQQPRASFNCVGETSTLCSLLAKRQKSDDNHCQQYRGPI
jgi:hypothetical protein